jgi:3-hydroxyisobutyrate dehydrogenase-like beta-hydroxyacid dehydrogenase
MCGDAGERREALSRCASRVEQRGPRDGGQDAKLIVNLTVASGSMRLASFTST